jgi:hypothetical protein
MLILEELGTFVVSVALALAVLGVAAVLLYYFNPQQPLDHAKAAFYPLVKPINATHVWLGVKPSADKVEVVELKYQYRGRWVDVPLARFTADRRRGSTQPTAGRWRCRAPPTSQSPRGMAQPRGLCLLLQCASSGRRAFGWI